MVRGHSSASHSSDYECDMAEDLLHDINATSADTVSDRSERELLIAVSRPTPHLRLVAPVVHCHCEHCWRTPC
jgi:hypothetical protein